MHEPIMILLFTFESIFGIKKVYISRDYLYAIDDIDGVFQEQIRDLNAAQFYNKENDTFERYTGELPGLNGRVFPSKDELEYVQYLGRECIVFREIIGNAAYRGYVKEFYAQLPEVDHFLMDQEKCMLVPGAILVDSDIYYRVGFLESHDPSFPEKHTSRFWELKSIETIQVDSSFFTDKLSSQ
jgi:hypothetical protein